MSADAQARRNQAIDRAGVIMAGSGSSGDAAAERIELKCWPPHFAAVADGKKTFELRRNDRNFQVGNRLLLREWIPGAGQPPEHEGYTGRVLSVVVTDMLRATSQRGVGWGLRPGYVVLSVRISHD